VRAYRLCIVLAAVFGAAPAAVAQDLLAPPPDLNLDEIGELPRSLSRPNTGLGQPSQAVTRGQAEPIDAGMVVDPVPEDRMLLYDPAVVWSSRSWLDRGYWYAVDEVVVTNREFDRRNVLLARDNSVGPDNNRSGRTLQIRSTRPGAVANARLTVGRFLFRDMENRDHLLETTFFGFGQEFQRDNVSSLLPNSLETGPSRILFNSVGTIPITTSGSYLALDNIDFDGSNSQAMAYTHELESLEFNYRVKQRMDRDWMVLRPNGEWVRQASPGMLKEFVAGIRWMSADEWLNWSAEGTRNGFMNVKANNDLLGVQLGLGASQAFARWELAAKGLAGVYANFARVNRDFEVRNNAAVISSDSVRAEEETIAFHGDFQLLLRYHIHQNFSFRFGYELFYLDSIAVAPFQTTFTPDFRQVGLSGSSVYQGFLLGIDGYW
jgi:hypothetical protein